ncbi:MAG: hypothetical protein IPL28_18325 [Chloroflexi bacterium]|nr:hypothetical protein [Chloroflexota bacterium]MDA0246220.1 hypothetical protein [Chloroflexota bacterium]
MMQTEMLNDAAEPTAVVEPTAAQLARVAALRRFNWLFVYGPLLALAVGLIGLMVWLIWATLAGPTAEGARVDVSAVADLIIIATSLPITFACLLLPGLAIGLAVHDRGREVSRIGWLQQKLWWVDNKVEWVRGQTAEHAPKLTRPIVAGNGWLAFFRSLATRLWHILTGK